jgi:cell division protein FtsL
MKSKQKHVFKLRWIFLLILITGMVFVLPLLHVWKTVMTIKLAKENNALKEWIERDAATNALLQIEVDALMTNKRIEQVAREQFQMDYPAPEQVLFIPARLHGAPLKRENYFASLLHFRKKS